MENYEKSYSIHVKAREDSERIDEFLKDKKGQTFKKIQINIKFSLAHNRAYLVYEILRNKGYVITPQSITVPD